MCVCVGEGVESRKRHLSFVFIALRLDFRASILEKHCGKLLSKGMDVWLIVACAPAVPLPSLPVLSMRSVCVCLAVKLCVLGDEYRLEIWLWLGNKSIFHQRRTLGT